MSSIFPKESIGKRHATDAEVGKAYQINDEDCVIAFCCELLPQEEFSAQEFDQEAKMVSRDGMIPIVLSELRLGAFVRNLYFALGRCSTNRKNPGFSPPSWIGGCPAFVVSVGLRRLVRTLRHF